MMFCINIEFILSVADPGGGSGGTRAPPNLFRSEQKNEKNKIMSKASN